MGIVGGRRLRQEEGREEGMCACDELIILGWTGLSDHGNRCELAPWSVDQNQIMSALLPPVPYNRSISSNVGH
jgi:hypothetical protein